MVTFLCRKEPRGQVKIRNFQQDRRKARRKVKQEKDGAAASRTAASRTAASSRISSTQTSKSKKENTAGEAGAAKKTRTKPNKKAIGRQGEDEGQEGEHKVEEAEDEGKEEDAGEGKEEDAGAGPEEDAERGAGGRKHKAQRRSLWWQYRQCIVTCQYSMSMLCMLSYFTYIGRKVPTK